ncbi:MAG: hypothetical protein KKI02_09660, partial [Planctomycetes bacterium]|nr:hypothetical protein [Planctomycetota bacterium]
MPARPQLGRLLRVRDQRVELLRQRARRLAIVQQATAFATQQIADAGVDPRRVVAGDDHRPAT